MKERLAQYGLTPAKTALVVALTLALGAVWGPRLLGRRAARPAVAAAAEPRPSAPPPPRSATPATGVAPSAPVETRAERPVTNLGLTEAVAYDPFAPPAWSPQARVAAGGGGADSGAAAADALAQRFEPILRSGVAMILVSSEGRAAQVGDRTLRVGDEVDGFEVIEINATGVVFRPIESAEEANDGGA